MYRTAARFGGNNLMPMIQPEQAKEISQRLTDKALEHISKMDGLESLFISDNEFSENAILKPGRLKSLKRLRCRLGADGRATLQRQLPDCKITD